ncbi:MAG TPA: APC family permease [Chloroflexota bacterium]|nr:APC family permease [Chloroflexota bacterium]
MQDQERTDARRETNGRVRADGTGRADATHQPEADIEYRQFVRGRRSGEQYVRIVRTSTGIRRRGRGHLEATREVFRPRHPIGRFLAYTKQILLGEPLATAQLAHERLTKVKALAVFSSDALSSSAYATEEILLVLVLAGTGALSLTIPISIAIATLLAIVAFSYRQTIRAYPQGGGSYIVTKDNLGTWPSLVAASALLIDYVLTVAVSISAGVAAVTSAIPPLLPYTVELAVGFVILITLINLRGVRESGTIFAAPTYLFIGSIVLMLVAGIARLAIGDLPPVPAREVVASEPLTVFLVLRAFASGCAALTGTEAISDGVPAFKPPEWVNARTTLSWMAIILGVLFLGISALARALQIVPLEDETVVSQIARAVFGDTPLYYVTQAATMAILVLAANTSFSDFPRLSYFLARDHFLPHQFQFRGDRLAFSTGILALGLVSIAVVVHFGAETHALIPLYAVGVFTAFTLSQASMVRRWWTRREPGWHRSMIINGIGATATGIVAIVIASAKFAHGAWIVLVLVPILVMIMRAVNRHYSAVAEQLAIEDGGEEELAAIAEPTKPAVIVPVAGLDRATAHTIAVARSLSPTITAVHVTDDPEEGQELQRRWEETIKDVPLLVLDSPYRSLVTPLLAFVDAVRQRPGTGTVLVVLSEYVPRHFWEYPLHNQSALRLKTALFFRPNTAVMDVPYHLER